MCRSRCLLASAALAGMPAILCGQTITDTTIPLTTHASGFSEATGIEFLGRDPNDFFVIEKSTGRVKRSLNGVSSIALDLGVASESERGLLGIAKDPNFASNGFVYLYYSKSSTGGDVTSGSWQENRLSRFTWNGSTLGSEAVLKTFSSSSDGQASGPNHDAGPIAFGPDGKLYGMTGDLNRNRAEQNISSTPLVSANVGGIYRYTTNANGTVSVPADNPFMSNGAAFQQWYAYGVRNSFGMTFDPLTGVMWETENGPTTYDEINRVASGFNSGWNLIMGPDSRDPQNEADLVHLTGSAYSDPEFSFFNPIAITGLDFLAKSTLDASYRDALLFADGGNFGQLYLLRVNANRDAFTSLPAGVEDLVADDAAQRDSVRFGQNFGAMTEIETGPDGGVYVVRLTDGAIMRLGFKSWKADASGLWFDSANWQGGVPASTNDYANFFGTISQPRTVTANGTVISRGIMFNSAVPYTITPTSIFGLQNFGGTAYLRVLQGSHTIAGQLQVSSNASLDVLDANAVMTISGPLTMIDSFTATKTGPGTVEAQAFVRASPFVTANLAVNGGTFRIIPNGTTSGTSIFAQLTTSGGKLDLTDNNLILTNASVGTWNGSAYSGVTAQIRSGRNGGNWSGFGIVTSMSNAQAAHGLTTLAVAAASDVLHIAASATGVWSGQTVTGDDPLVLYTWAGDANLSGFVDADDYWQIDAHYGTSDNSKKSFFNGDFDYDGDVDGDDYFFIDTSYLGQSGSLYPGSASGSAAVPEPAAISLLLLGVLRRRRRQPQRIDAGRYLRQGVWPCAGPLGRRKGVQVFPDVAPCGGVLPIGSL